MYKLHKLHVTFSQLMHKPHFNLNVELCGNLIRKGQSCGDFFPKKQN